MARILGNLARQTVTRAKQIPALRRFLASPAAAPVVATAAKWFPPADPAYERWIVQRIRQRRDEYPPLAEPGLLSLITPVWNTPPQYLMVLAASVFQQSAEPPFEWIVLDNGSTHTQTLEVLEQVLRPDPRVRLFRSETNLGIIGGMRYCLERASGRYVVAVDHDDRLDPDCLTVLTHHIQRQHDPPLLYSDEDHLCSGNRLLPYFKPAWDPVLFLNSAYTAHVGVMDRRLALELDVYGDPTANSCPDWDAFLRFYLAGYEPVHVPEIVYSWRMHPGSTSANMHSKRDVAASHRAMLDRYRRSLAQPDRYEIIRSPLFAGTPDWWIRRRHVVPRPMLLVVMTAGRHSAPQTTTAAATDYPCTELITIAHQAHPSILADQITDIAAAGGLVVFLDDTLQIEGDEWAWEALGLIERHPEIGVVGGRIIDSKRRVVDAGRYFGRGGRLFCPDAGRAAGDPGYFHQMWKQHCVDAVSPRFCVFEATFLGELLSQVMPVQFTLADLGSVAGGYAARTGRRVVYSPFLSASGDDNWRETAPALPDAPERSRYYSAALDTNIKRAYQPVFTADQTCEVK